ncbi:hypothetical protein [Halobacillus litoralis]|uniref:Uncharacterized protein n=1 Tax=Halobacillus litoralis TaxID=45668 RepID=A0A410MJ53_9BACI|nr:hypothetical protein [Halobacillus litoralis]QAS54759.1 hypothetical protein HLI_21110 [Halobacillus litoralis]
MLKQTEIMEVNHQIHLGKLMERGPLESDLNRDKQWAFLFSFGHISDYGALLSEEERCVIYSNCIDIKWLWNWIALYPPLHQPTGDYIPLDKCMAKALQEMAKEYGVHSIVISDSLSNNEEYIYPITGVWIMSVQKSFAYLIKEVERMGGNPETIVQLIVRGIQSE